MGFKSRDISFEHAAWSLAPETPEGCVCAWVGPQEFMIVLQHFGPDKALRERLADVDAVRAHYRDGFAKDGLGLIECDVFELDGLWAARAIAKLIVQPTRAAYAGTIALPLPSECYVFNVVAEETGISGTRETAIWIRTSTELEAQGYEMEVPPETQSEDQSASAPMVWKHPQTGAVRYWAEDPYDRAHQGPSLRNLADAPEYDREFPDHPLSRVREALRRLTESVRLSAALKKRAHARNG